MSEKSKKLEVCAVDHYGDECFGDGGQRSEKRPRGWVEVHEVQEDGKKKLISKSNLVLYCGREWVAERIFNQVNEELPDWDSDDANRFICWFGVGSGGCPDYDPLDPLPPTVTDTELNRPTDFGPNHPTYAELIGGRYYKHPFASLTFDPDPDNQDAYLICRVEIILDESDVGLDDRISEAGLFTATSSAPLFAGPFRLFARTTFPTLVKTAERQISFTWFIYV